MKSKKSSLVAAALVFSSITTTPQVAEAHHQGFWVAGRTCDVNAFGNLFNCFNEQVWATDHLAINCASNFRLPVFIRGFGNFRQYSHCI